MVNFFNQLYSIMDKGPLRALSLILALVLAGCVLWNPFAFAAETSKLQIWHSFFVMWAISTGLVHGVGFKPRKLRWRIFFTPLPAMIILIVSLIYFIGL